MEQFIILIIFLTIMMVTLLGMFMKKLLIFNGLIFGGTERIVGWKAVLFGFMLEIIFAVAMFIWITSDRIEFTNLQLIAGIVISILLTMPLYMLMHMIETKRGDL